MAMPETAMFVQPPAITSGCWPTCQSMQDAYEEGLAAQPDHMGLRLGLQSALLAQAKHTALPHPRGTAERSKTISKVDEDANAQSKLARCTAFSGPLNQPSTLGRSQIMSKGIDDANTLTLANLGDVSRSHQHVDQGGVTSHPADTSVDEDESDMSHLGEAVENSVASHLCESVEGSVTSQHAVVKARSTDGRRLLQLVAQQQPLLPMVKQLSSKQAEVRGFACDCPHEHQTPVPLLGRYIPD